jgi:hypothetical protein
LNDEVIWSAVAAGAPVVALRVPNGNGLASQWAYAHRREFIGGYLAVDFAAYQVGSGVEVRAVLAQCLRALDAVNLPPSLAQRMTMFHAFVRSRGRMVIGLDNANQAAQVRPFIVPNSLVIVSSYRRLGGLITDRALFLEV